MNNSDLIKKNHKYHLLLLVILFCISGCFTTQKNELKQKILTENIEVACYDFESNEMTEMIYVIQDSLNYHYNCNKIDFLNLGVFKEEDIISYSFGDGGNRFGYSSIKESRILLKVAGVLIFLKEADAKDLVSIGKLTNRRKCNLKYELNKDFNDCLYKRKHQDIKKVIFSIGFEKKSEDAFELKRFIHFIE